MDATQSLELRQRKPPVEEGGELARPSSSPSSATATSAQGDHDHAHALPLSQLNNVLDTSLFHKLNVSNISPLNLSLCHPSTGKPVFTVINSMFTPSRPSVSLLSGTGRILAVARLGCRARHLIFGIGDTNSPKEVRWEKFEQVSPWWINSQYLFVWEHERFLWERKRFDWTGGPQEDWELRREGQKELLASYEAKRGWVWKDRGELYLRKGGQDFDWEHATGDEWEFVVLITALALIEAARRRAWRRRRF